MKIGNFEPDNNIFLAPMAGITDISFRILCKELMCGLTYSEMVSAKGLMYNSKNTKELLKIDKREGKIAIQIFGSDKDILADMVKRLEHNENIALFDINMGCPASKIIKNNEGSALMKEPKLVGEIVKKVSSSTKKPVTIKIRKGYTQDNINAVEIAKIAEENGASAIAIHGRTAKQLYTGVADWDIIKKVKENVSIPVIGNGDITSPIKAKEMIDYTNCDAIMIARASRGNPFIFKETLHYLKTGKLLDKPTDTEKIHMAINHLELIVKNKGEHIGIREMRKHIGWYIKGMYKSTEARILMNKIDNEKDAKALLLSLI